jgi:Fe-S-cluster containining protein
MASKSHKAAPSSGHGVSKPKRKGPARKKVYKWDWVPPCIRYTQGYERINDETGIAYRHYPTIIEVADEFKIPVDSVAAQSAKEGWQRKRNEFQEQVKEAERQAALQALREAELRIRRKALKGAERILDRIAGTDSENAMLDAADPEELATLANALRRGQEVANVAIGIPKDGVKAPGSDDPSAGVDGQPVTAWARMRASRQEIVVGVQIIETN